MAIQRVDTLAKSDASVRQKKQLKKEIVSLKDILKEVQDMQKKNGYQVPHEFMVKLIQMDKTIEKIDQAVDDGDRLWLLERQASNKE